MSCQTTAGASGAPVSVSHSTAVARWVLMATPTTWCRVRSCSAQVAQSTSRVAARMRAASCSTNPGAGLSVARRRYCSLWVLPSASTIAARVPLVPSSMERITSRIHITFVFVGSSWKPGASASSSTFTSARVGSQRTTQQMIAAINGTTARIRKVCPSP